MDQNNGVCEMISSHVDTYFKASKIANYLERDYCATTRSSPHYHYSLKWTLYRQSRTNAGLTYSDPCPWQVKPERTHPCYWKPALCTKHRLVKYWRARWKEFWRTKHMREPATALTATTIETGARFQASRTQHCQWMTPTSEGRSSTTIK